MDIKNVICLTLDVVGSGVGRIYVYVDAGGVHGVALL